MLKKCLTLLCLLLAVCFLAEVTLPAAVTGALAETKATEQSTKDGEKTVEEEDEKGVVRMTMYAGQSKKLHVSTKGVKWSSDSTKIATVSNKGLVITKKAGKVLITVRDKKDDSVIMRFLITVKSSLSVKPKTVNLNTGDSKTVTVTYQLSSGKVKATVSNDSIVKAKLSHVSGKTYKLVLTGKKAGKTKVTVFNTKTSENVTLNVVVSEAAPTPAPTTDPTSEPTSDPTTGVTYRALVIGNGTGYRYLNPLSAIAKDVKAMKGALNGLNQNWQVTAKENLTVAEMKSAISTAFAGATENDICLFFYSGHGDNGTGSTAGALCGVECDGYDAGLFTPAELRDCLNAATPGKVIVTIDACGSGSMIYDKASSKRFTSALINALKGPTIQEVNSKTGELRDANKYAVLVACEYGTTSMGAYVTQDSLNAYASGRSSSPYLSGSAFTYALVKTMGCGFPSGSYNGSMAADTDGDGKLSLKETFTGVSGTMSTMDRIWREFVQEYLSNNSEYLDYFEQETRYFGTDSMVLFSR